MAKRNRYRDILNDRGNFYSGWLPRDNGYTWMNNEAYAQWKRELEYLRRHPKQADPEALLALMTRIFGSWEQERRDFLNEFNGLLEVYEEALQLLKDNEEEFVRLNNLINALHQRINEAVIRQNELQERLDGIERRKANDRNIAIRYRNDAVEILNRLAETVYFEKYAPGELDALRYLIREIDKGNLTDGAVQGLAVECIAKACALERMVERKRSEFEILHMMAMQQMTELRRRYDNWGNETYFDEAKQHKMDVDYWSRGAWNRAYSHMKVLEASLTGADKVIGYRIENLQADIESITHLNQVGEEIIERALALSYQSEMAKAMGELIASIMCEIFMFRTVFMGYNNDDERESFVVQMYSHTYEMKIQFILTPLNEKEIGCIYHASTGKYIREEYLDEILKHINAELRFNDVLVVEQDKKEDSHWVPDIEFVPKGRKCVISQSFVSQSSN